MRRMMFFFFSWTLAVLGLPLLGVAVICHILGLKGLRSAIADGYLAYLARCLIRLTGSKVTVEGLEAIPPEGPVLFVSNHQGHFDSAVFLGYIRKPKSFVASSAASKFPIFSTWFRYAQTVFLEIGNVRQNYTALKGAKEILNEGRSIVIYPEGVISAGSAMGELKRGALKIAFATGVPIVPVVIDGTWKVMGENNDKIEPAIITAKILPPIPTKGLSRPEQQELPGEINAAIQKELDYLKGKK
ncbi:MAG: 1-acyl-sn-glycerol-3-phosphate acyltransferase [Limnochordia bacterium]|nr:1-acyl-sn-glycerol-3-phosphate acyltransferase [Limnochordia bacterium]